MELLLVTRKIPVDNKKDKVKNYVYRWLPPPPPPNKLFLPMDGGMKHMKFPVIGGGEVTRHHRWPGHVVKLSPECRKYASGSHLPILMISARFCLDLPVLKTLRLRRRKWLIMIFYLPKCFLKSSPSFPAVASSQPRGPLLGREGVVEQLPRLVPEHGSALAPLVRLGEGAEVVRILGGQLPLGLEGDGKGGERGPGVSTRLGSSWYFL